MDKVRPWCGQPSDREQNTGGDGGRECLLEVMGFEVMVAK